MRRARATRTAAPGQSVNIGIRLTRLSADTSSVRSNTTMNIVRNISGPVESGALPGTEPGLVGDYQFRMEGIIATDLLEWRGEWGGDGFGDETIVTLLTASGNVANFNIAIPVGTSGNYFIYCSVNGVEFIGSGSAAVP